jgi:sodium/potassium-transporting ATPase subunit alpha
VEKLLEMRRKQGFISEYFALNNFFDNGNLSLLPSLLNSFVKDVTSHCHRINILASGSSHLINSLASTSQDKDTPGMSKSESLRRELTKEGRSGLAFPTPNIEHVRQWHEKVYEIPFNSSYKWQMSIHDAGLSVRNIATDDSHQPSPEFMTLKGAPDVLLPKCSHYITTCEGGTGHKIVRIDRNFTNTVNKVFEQMASHGERALGFAMKWMHKSFEEFEAADPTYKDKLKDSLVGNSKLTIEKNLVFVGLLSLIDPPRPEVPTAIAKCKSSGIQVVMVTGDYPATALYIARKIGLFTHPTRSEMAIQRGVKESAIPEDEVKAITVHGSMIESMTPEDWNIVTRKEQIVFARTTPEQKLTIVKHFMADGHVVAMTGDGVNDSSALKHASIGVCMGRTGSDIAREAADIILLDDNFASIVVAIQEGRLLFDNLKKSVAYTLSHLLPEVLPVLLHFGMGLPLGLPAVLALSLDLITEVLPAAAMAYETPEADIMNRPPRDVRKDRLTGMPVLFYAYCIIGAIEALACLFIYFNAFQSYGLTPSFIYNYGSQFFKNDADMMMIVSDDPNELDIELSAEDQMVILHHVQSTYFLSIIIMQILHAFEVRARTTPILERGVLGNIRLIFSCICAVLIGVLLIFGHGAGSNYLETEEPITPVLVVGALGGAAAIYIYNETRKHWLMSKSKERQSTETARNRLDAALSLSEARRGISISSSGSRPEGRMPRPPVSAPKRRGKSYWERLLQW